MTLARRGVAATFLVVGEVAPRYPEIVRAIAAAGHELGCHAERHTPLDQLTPDAFAADLRANPKAVQAAGRTEVRGFRAPVLSLTEKTARAYEIVAAEGFAYSSSVLPAAIPLYGWRGFGHGSRRGGVFEIPVTLAHPIGRSAIPVFCGTHFRVLPWSVVKRQIPRQPANEPLVCYFHPYDIDHRQPWITYSGVRVSRSMNALMFVRR